MRRNVRINRDNYIWTSEEKRKNAYFQACFCARIGNTMVEATDNADTNTREKITEIEMWTGFQI